VAFPRTDLYQFALRGYLRYDSEAAREAINDLYRQELRLLQNLFLIPGRKVLGASLSSRSSARRQFANGRK
jgi:hypothetical protein